MIYNLALSLDNAIKFSLARFLWSFSFARVQENICPNMTILFMWQRKLSCVNVSSFHDSSPKTWLLYAEVGSGFQTPPLTAKMAASACACMAHRQRSFQHSICVPCITHEQNIVVTENLLLWTRLLSGQSDSKTNKIYKYMIFLCFIFKIYDLLFDERNNSSNLFVFLG